MVTQMYQVSTLQALTKGDFYGNCTIGQLLTKGDTGLGTFKDVDGEMIVLDGGCYRAKADGTVEVAQEDDSTPFASVTFLNKSLSFQLTKPIRMNKLLDKLDMQVKFKGENNIYACRIDGKFAEVYARSEMKQQEPYKPFADVLATDQREFDFHDVSGSLVCVYFPKYMDGLNMAGWHVHFISDDRTMGGHVFDFELNEGVVHLGETSGFAFMIPDTDHFHSLKLQEVTKKDIEKVEKAK